MPKRIRKKDLNTFYYSFEIGKDGNEVVYSEIQEAQGEFTSFEGTRFADYYGEEFDYNATLIVQEQVKYISTISKIWLSSYPLNNKEEPTHIVRGKSKIKDGLYTIYLKNNISNTQSLWIEYSGRILELNLEYDFENKVAKMPLEQFCPINILTNVWERKPVDIYQKENKIQLLYSKIENGFTILHFKKG